MPQVEIFRTNVPNKRVAHKAILDLSKGLPEYKINFDLEDCDKVLRVMGSKVNVKEILKRMKQLGHSCEVIK
ncbi:MAG: hypothetical protein KF860_03125 [Cyclobacteriaceae bacterium]|nr:hypothetical protein [Cyclobacteriaceae bacterium]